MTPKIPEPDKLKLGKGVAFVKSQLRYLRQEDDTWEADFFPIPCSSSPHGCVWMGMVLGHTDDFLLAERMVKDLLSVNDLADLLAQAMHARWSNDVIGHTFFSCEPGQIGRNSYRT